MENISLIKQRMQAAQDRQKSYADRKRKPMEFEVGDRVMLKKVAYKLELPQELSRVHHTFHVSNLKKCYADEPLVMPLEGIHVDDKLQFVEEPVEIMEREIKRLKRSRIPLVKVRWNSRRGPEFTWECEDSFKQKYPQLFTNRASSSTTRHVKRGQDTKIPQSSGPPVKVGDEAVHKELGDRMERAATTASSLEAEQDSVTAAELLTTVRHHLVLPVQVNAAEVKAKTFNGERQLQALVDKKKVIIMELSIRSNLHLEDAGGTNYFLTATIFEELARMGPQKKQSRRKQRKETKVPQDETHHDDSVPIPSNDPLLSEEGPKVERIKKSRTTGLKRLRKFGKSRRVESSEDKDIDENQGRSDDAEMFDIDDLHGDEVIVDMTVGEKQEQSAKVDERDVSTGVEDSDAPTIPVTTAGKGVTATKIDEITTTSAPTTAIDEITLAQTLIEIKATKPKAVTTAATTTTTTRPKARGVVVQEPSEFRTTTSSPQSSQPSKTKYKGNAIMIEPEVHLKRKDQVALDEEIARNLEAQLQGELIEEEMLARKKGEEANIALIESWENTQAMIEADRLLAERLQTREQQELTDEEKAKLFIEIMEKRRKHFATLRA
ncbi:hypothetical protein Tco_0140926 [Tanacetum coccineum]